MTTHDLLEVPAGRVYLHNGCRGETNVTGRSFSMICDPFRTFVRTYCAGCSKQVPLDDVRWVDTGEPVMQFRERMRRLTPTPLRIWREKGAWIFGGMGFATAYLIAQRVGVPRDQYGPYAVGATVIAAGLSYYPGTLIANRLFGIDYRRFR